MDPSPELHHFLSIASARFRALADPSRLMILMLLKARGETPVSQIAAAAGISQPVASKHLALLRQNGLVQTRRDGTTIAYSLRDDTVARLCDIMCNSLQQDHTHLGAALAAINRPTTSEDKPSKRPRRPA